MVLFDRDEHMRNDQWLQPVMYSTFSRMHVKDRHVMVHTERVSKNRSQEMDAWFGGLVLLDFYCQISACSDTCGRRNLLPQQYCSIYVIY